MKHSYGWNPDRPDQRDLLFIPHVPEYQAQPFPPAVDLRPGCPPIYDQGQIGSCTANAIAAAIDFERKRQKLPFIFPSRLFVYWNERELEGTTASDSGATLRDGFKVISKQGVCPEPVWPYSLFFDTRPDFVAFESAFHHKTLQYLSVAQQQADMLDCLAQGYPFVFGITVYESFEADVVAKTGIVPMPAATERTLGGHALLAVGYRASSPPGSAQLAPSRDNTFILFRNSWGESWGDKGYGTIPLQYLTNPDLASDFWTIRMEEA